MDQLFEARTQVIRSGKDKLAAPASTSASNFFGILKERRTPAECIATDNTGKARWSSFPPIRFGVEFWGIEGLKEKSRLHSQTIWYAGSLFNVYVQVVRKKGLQLGVYLHRQSSVDPIPIPSAPPLPLSHHLGVLRDRGSSLTSVPHPMSASTPSLYRPASRSNVHAPTRSTTPTSTHTSAAPTSGSPLNSVSGLPQPPHVPPPSQPYRDPRPAILAHFTIYCASPTGASLTRFSSAPDVFSVSQSWGWKSSSLQTEEYIDVVEGEAGAGHHGPQPKEVSLRATVVLGVV